MTDPREQLIHLVSQLLAIGREGQKEALRAVPVLVLVTDEQGEVTDWRLQTLEEATGVVAALNIAAKE